MTSHLKLPNYRVSAWFQPLSEWTEDDLEEAILEKLKELGLICQGGPVVHEIYPSGG